MRYMLVTQRLCTQKTKKRGKISVIFLKQIISLCDSIARTVAVHISNVLSRKFLVVMSFFFFNLFVVREYLKDEILKIQSVSAPSVQQLLNICNINFVVE